MSQLFDLPEGTVQDAYQLFQQLDKKQKPSSNDYSDVFFAVKGSDGKIEVVDKTSPEGRWLAFKAKIRHSCGYESELSKGRKALQKLTHDTILKDKGFIETVIQKSAADTKDPAQVA